MDKYVDELKKQIDVLYEKIYKKKDFLVAYNLLEKGRSKYQCIFLLPEIINKNLQIGNYRRVIKYYILANNLMNDIEQNEKLIENKITDYIMED